MNLQKNLEKSDNVVFIGRIESLITDKEYEKNYTLVLEKEKIAGNILKMNNEKVIIKQKNNNKNLNQGQKIGDIIEITGMVNAAKFLKTDPRIIKRHILENKPYKGYYIEYKNKLT